MNNHSLKIVFAGTPDFAAVALQAILEAGHQVMAVYCQPDRPSGRGKKLVAGPVKKLAEEKGLPVEQPLNFKETSDIKRLSDYQADLMVVVAYGLLLPQSVLDTPKYGCLNIHGSLLPRWRGAAPIQRAIENGDSETGITIMQMDKGLDTGNMLLKVSCPIDKQETGSSLHDKLAQLGGQAINQYLATYSPEFCGEVQDDSLANYAHKLSKQEAQIDWSKDASDIERKVRALNAWPVCFTHAGNKRIRVWQVELTDNHSTNAAGSVIAMSKHGIEVVCGDQKTLLLKELQPDGSKRMDAVALLNSRKDWFIENPVLGQHD
ncbi:methionyl-tRNA formyltransferase [Aliikangiella sp. IMCC44359]|uniref:methionyl-tRNA formyltransferase n=1 Tax=Aliikangiella sp. IMCC44359 TaxID=3459125 RepID=UPI00403B24FF